MSEALARIFALQQREINEIERQRQLARAQHEREIAAFQNSGLPEIFRTLADVPVRNDVRQRIYKSTFGDLAWDHCNPRKVPRAKELLCVSLGGSSGASPRWWCQESRDTGRVKYCYNDGVSSRTTSEFDTCDGTWLATFLEYAAKACDPEAIAQKMSATAADTPGETPRRRLQPV